MGIRSHIHVEVVAKEIAFPVRIPAPVAVRLRVVAFTVTGRTAIIPAVAEPLFSAAVQQYGQESRHRQGKDEPNQSARVLRIC